MNKQRKILLYFPKVHSDTRPCRVTPLSLLAISRILAVEGYNIKIISEILSVDHIQEIIKNCQDSICLGITCMTGFQIYDALRVANIVRGCNPKLPIVWGGWHPSILPEETIGDTRVDIVVRGQGERKFAEVVHALAEHASFESIKGITYKLPDGQIVTNPDSDACLEDMNNFPAYPYHLIDVEKCLGRTEYGRRTIQYISSYGCPHRCGFCIEPIVNKQHWTGLSAERVVADWEHLYKKYGIDSVAVYDSNFFVKKNRVHQICLGLLRKNLKIKWGNADGRISQLVNYEPEIWEAMERSGCSMILTGAESGSQEVLELIQKDLDVSQIEKFTRLCSKYHIRVFFSYIVGLPFSHTIKENKQHVEKQFSSTLHQIDKIMKIDKIHRFSISIYTPYPGSTLYDRALQLGLTPPDTLEDWSRFIIAVPEDAFALDIQRKWITPRQSMRIAMITQYIFGMMDIQARNYIASKMNPYIRPIFLFSWNIGLLFAHLRWKFKFWLFPFDFWVYTQVRKYLKLV